MRKYLFGLVLLVCVPLMASAQSLVGSWKSPKSEVSLGGSAEFRADGTFTLLPDGTGPATGHYTLDGVYLSMRLDSSPQFPAEGVVEWLKQGKAMRIQFAKGPAQEFLRVTDKTTPPKGKKK